MSEYMEIEAEVDEDEPQQVHFYTNLPLSRAEAPPERYQSVDELEEGSAFAQALTIVSGIERVEIEGGDMTIWRAPDTAEHGLIADVSAVIKDFFL